MLTCFVSTLRLSAAEVFPDELVVGISIGAINAALIVGNPPELRVDDFVSSGGKSQ